MQIRNKPIVKSSVKRRLTTAELQDAERKSKEYCHKTNSQLLLGAK